MRVRQRKEGRRTENLPAGDERQSSVRSTAELLRLIESDPIMQRLLQLTTVLRSSESERQDVDPAHDLSHCLRVALWTLRLGGTELNVREAIAAALLHEAVSLPKAAHPGPDTNVLSGKLAREVLPGAAFRPKAVVTVSQAIEDHSYRAGAIPRSALGRAMQDAHRLDALGAFGVLRAATQGVQQGAAYLDIRDPWARQRPLNEKRFTIDHIIEQLEMLEQTMQTPAGRAEVQRRIVFIRLFLSKLGEEIGETCASSAAEGD